MLSNDKVTHDWSDDVDPRVDPRIGPGVLGRERPHQFVRRPSSEARWRGTC